MRQSDDQHDPHSERHRAGQADESGNHTYYRA
jgi:hypothetical protein